MRRVLPLVVLVVACAAAGASAGLDAQGTAPGAPGAPAGDQRRAQPPRAQRANEEPPRGSSVIRGFVVAADSGAPIRRAQVRAFSAESRDTRVTTTDDQGRFELKELVGGRYTVTASKGGFVTLQYGQRRPSEQGTPLDVAEGRALDKVGIALPRGSVIAGRIVDEQGEPVTGAQVRALRYGYAGGARRLTNAGGSGANDRTDDQGSFRLFGLTPGEYIVSAALRGGPMSAVDGDDEPSGYAPTYYPGTPSVADAQRITVGVGEESPAVIFALTLTRLVRVTGRVLNSQGQPAAGATVMAMATASDSPGRMGMPGTGRGSQVRPDGTFELTGIAPGSYTINVRERGGPDGEFGGVPVVVGTADLSGVAITTGRGATASGRIVTDQDVPPSFGPNQVRVMAVAATGEPGGFFGGGGGPGRTNDDFTFELRGLADTRLLRVSPPAGWALKAIEHEGADITDTPLDFRGGGDVRNLRVVLTQSLTDLSGLVTDDRGQPLIDATVVVFPDDEARWGGTSRYIRAARPDQQGRYQFRGLPPYQGYLVAVVQGLEDGQANDPEFLATLKPAARRVSLGAGETKSFDVRR